jgi:hypothetical protein
VSDNGFDDGLLISILCFGLLIMCILAAILVYRYNGQIKKV